MDAVVITLPRYFSLKPKARQVKFIELRLLNAPIDLNIHHKD